MPEPSAEKILDVNVRYHDLASQTYDSKWGIDYGEKGAQQVLAKMRKALGQPLRPMGRGLEIGAGTGYFSLNLLKQGILSDVTCTDVSAGMLETLASSAERMHLDVETVVCDAENLPFPNDTFDVVFGHAVLHHIPDLEQAFREFRRVLRPGGRIAFCGEPSHHGDRLAALPKRAALAISPYWRRLLGVGRRMEGWDDAEAVEHGLEHVVDVHAFTPSQLEAFASRAGFEGVRVSGEELVAGWFGWANRTLESTAESRQIPALWFQYAYRGYMALKALDDHVLEPALPPAIFYNLLVSAEVPLDAEPAQPAPRATTVAAAR